MTPRHLGVEVWSCKMADELDQDHAARVSAYHAWEAAGRPAGQDLDFWLSATSSPPLPYPYSAREVIPMQFGYEGGISAQPPVADRSAGEAAF